MRRPYRRVDLAAQQWAHIDVGIPIGFWQRLVGIAAKDIDAILIRARSVHTFGLGRPIAVCAIDEAGRVLGHRTLAVNRLFRAPEAAWILEMDHAAPRPGVGAHLSVASSGNARNPHRVCDTHRESC